MSNQNTIKPTVSLIGHVTKFHPWYRRALQSIGGFFKGIASLFFGLLAILAGLGTAIGVILMYLAVAALPIILVVVCLKYLFS